MVTSELAQGVSGVDARGSLEHLDDGLGARHFQHLTRTVGTIIQAQLHDFGELRELHFVQDNQWTVDTRHRFVG